MAVDEYEMEIARDLEDLKRDTLALKSHDPDKSYFPTLWRLKDAAMAVFQRKKNRAEKELKAAGQEFLAAAMLGDVEGVTAFLEKYPRHIFRSEDHETVLHWAAYSGNAEVVRKVLAVMIAVHPKIVSDPDKEGNTPLMLAAENGHAEAAQVLAGEMDLDDLEKKNARGMTARMLAEKGGHGWVVRLIDERIEAEQERKAFIPVTEAGWYKAMMQRNLPHELGRKFRTAIDCDPASLEAVAAYGAAVIGDVKQLGRHIAWAVWRLEDEMVAVNRVMDDVAKRGTDLASDILPGKKLPPGGLSLAFISGFLPVLKTDVPSVSEKDIMCNLPEAYYESLKLLQPLFHAEGRISNTFTEVEGIAVARISIAREIKTCLEGAPAILRRYDEVYIKEAKAAFDESQSPEDELYLANVIKGKEVFQRQCEILESASVQSLDAAQQLRTLIDGVQKQREVLRQFIVVYKNEWTALIATAGFQGAAWRLSGKSDGAVDHAKLLKSLDLMRAVIEKENEARKLPGVSMKQLPVGQEGIARAGFVPAVTEIDPPPSSPKLLSDGAASLLERTKKSPSKVITNPGVVF